MTIILQAKKIRQKCSQFLRDNVTTIGKFSQIIGMLVATNIAVLSAPHHYHALWIKALYCHHSYKSVVILNYQSSLNLQWWITHLNEHNGRPTLILAPDVTVKSDASNMGLEGLLQQLHNKRSVVSFRTLTYIYQCQGDVSGILGSSDINFAKDQQATHVRLKIDNATAVITLITKEVHTSTLWRISLWRYGHGA